MKRALRSCWFIFMFLLVGLGSHPALLFAQADQKLQVTVYDSDGKVAYEGAAIGSIYPFSSGIEAQNPQGRGTLRIPFDQAVECSFVRVDKESLTRLDLDKIDEYTKSSKQTLDEFVKLYPLRIQYVLADGTKYVGTGGLGEGLKVSVTLPDQKILELSTKEFGKLVIKRK